jgi:hypothetical protein
VCVKELLGVHYEYVAAEETVCPWDEELRMMHVKASGWHHLSQAF